MKLDPQTTRKTDDQFYKEHPEMVKDGKRIPINPKNPAHKGMAGEWMGSYRQISPNPTTTKSKPVSKKTSPPGQAVAQCPNAPKPKSKPVPPCCFKGVTIKCGHGDRGYSMSLPLSPKAIEKKETEFHVIAGHTRPDKIEIILKGGPCTRGVPENPNVASSTREDNLLESKSKITLDAFAPERRITNPGHWKSMIWPDVITDCLTYPVTATACEGASDCSTTIKAFPYVKWKISAGFGLPGAQPDKKSSGFTSDEFDTKKFIEYSRETNGWKFKPIVASLELDKGNSDACTKIELAPEFSSYVKDTLTVFQNFKDFSDLTGGFMSSMGGPEWTVKYPAVEISYECETVEIEGTPRVGVQGKAALSLAPLIGIEFSYDVLNWLLGMANIYAPGLGTILVKIKKRAEEGFLNKKVKVELSLKFTMGGTIEGELSWTKPEASAPNWNNCGEIKEKIEGSFVGKAASSADVWLFSAGAGAMLGGKTGVDIVMAAGHDESGLYLESKLQFTGVTIFYSIYSTVGRVSKPAKTEYSDDSREFVNEAGPSKEIIDQEPDVKYSDEYPLVESKEWPTRDGGKLYLISNT